MSYIRQRIYITYKHQSWTSKDKSNLYDCLDGSDDKILEFYVLDKDFAIILKDGYTYDVVDTKQDAIDYINNIYREYDFYDQTDEYCYIPINNPKVGYLSESAARNKGYYNVMYVPSGSHYLVKNGRVIGKAWSNDELRRMMYNDFGAKFTYQS